MSKEREIIYLNYDKNSIGYYVSMRNAISGLNSFHDSVIINMPEEQKEDENILSLLAEYEVPVIAKGVIVVDTIAPFEVRSDGELLNLLKRLSYEVMERGPFDYEIVPTPNMLKKDYKTGLRDMMNKGRRW